ncbi:FORKED 1 protein, partial [Tanacetum coccineum]
SIASATTLVVAQCVEVAEAMGTEREHLIAVVNANIPWRYTNSRCCCSNFVILSSN